MELNDFCNAKASKMPTFSGVPSLYYDYGRHGHRIVGTDSGIGMACSFESLCDSFVALLDMRQDASTRCALPFVQLCTTASNFLERLSCNFNTGGLRKRAGLKGLFRCLYKINTYRPQF